MACKPYVVTREQWKRSCTALAGEVAAIDFLHREIIDQGRKVLNATAEGMSQTEFIEWVMERLEGK